MNQQNEDKKTLYKEKPYAFLIHTDDDATWTYQATVNGREYTFKVPANERNEKFSHKMEAQLLIRWMV